MVKRLVWLLPLLALASLPAPARGADPKISLKLSHVTCAQALRELEQATSVPLDVRLTPFSAPAETAGAPVERRPDLQEPADFDWSHATLGQALRELCQRYQLTFAGNGASYTLYRSDRPQLPSAPAGSSEKNGFRVGVRDIHVQRTRNAPGGTGQMSVTLVIQAVGEGVDVDSIWSVENVVARDDRGNIIVLDARASVSGAGPDSVIANCSAPAPDPAATRLTWLDCEVVTVRRVTPVQFEAPLPLPKEGLVAERDGVRFELLKFQPGETLKAPPTAIKDLIYAQEHGSQLEATLTMPGDERLTAAHSVASSPAPYLRGASGKLYTSGRYRFGGGNGGPGQPSQYHGEWGFNAIPEPATQVVFRMLRKGDADRVTAFHLRDIPLPRGGGVSPTQGWYPGKPFGQESRLFQERGATLQHQVTINGRAASGGRLFVRLDDPAGGAPVEWVSCEVDRGGKARLGPLKPGTYRMLRAYQPPSGETLPAGAWQGSEARVQAAAEKVTDTPPLRLGPTAPAKAVAPAAKPVMAPADGPATVTDASVEVQSQETLRFVRPVEHQVFTSGTLLLGGRCAAEYLNRLSGIQNLVAMDENGHLITGVGPLSQAGQRWTARVHLSGLAPEARRLEWIEGEIMGWKNVQPLRVEFGPEALKQPQKKQVGAVTFEILEPTPQRSMPAQLQGPSLRARLSSAPNTALAGTSQQMQPVLVGASGKTYPLSLRRAAMGSDGDRFRAEVEGWYPGVTEAIASIRFEVALQSEQQRVAAFRLTGVALPEDPLSETPQRAPAAKRLASGHPLYAEDGGSLVAPVMIGGKPAAGGTLSIGLAPAQGATRWIEVEVPVDGPARVEGLKPGTYRVLRLYRPAEKSPLSGRGQWQHAEERVTVTAGKAATLPPLEWVTAPVPVAK